MKFIWYLLIIRDLTFIFVVFSGKRENPQDTLLSRSQKQDVLLVYKSLILKKVFAYLPFWYLPLARVLFECKIDFYWAKLAAWMLSFLLISHSVTSKLWDYISNLGFSFKPPNRKTKLWNYEEKKSNVELWNFEKVMI